MKKNIFLLIFSLFLFLGFQPEAKAQSLSEMLSGRILLDVERNGEAWYVYPLDGKRYYLGRPHDAFSVMRNLGLGISERDFNRIPEHDSEGLGDQALVQRLAGRIILQVEKKGEAWYINPLNNKKYYLGRPDDAFRIMRELGLGISRKNLAIIHKNTLNESINKYSSYYFNQPIKVDNNEFFIDFIEISLDNPNLQIITDTANSENCSGRCSAKSLVDFVSDNNAFAGINGSYFDTSAEKLNYYFFPVYNSRLKKMINADQLKYPTTGPLMVFDTDNKFYYFKDSRDFLSPEKFEEEYNVEIQAALGNKPRLIEEGKSLLIDWELDGHQANVKALRGALAFKKGVTTSKGKIYLIFARNATINDLAEILKVMQVDYAINIDGGYSSALFYNDEYMLGPGRNIPNAILFSEVKK